MTIETALKIVSSLSIIFYLISAYLFAMDAPEWLSGTFAILMMLAVMTTSVLTHFL